ncbi:MAG: DNA polymerase III subunit delta [Lactobacillaceae bacterium]|jgi:DNA polymerase-3 subunit delta|nr:DNA polymerase III subunit delta [Lactobacillaceae bacterium]
MKINDFTKNYLNQLPPVTLFQGTEPYFVEKTINQIKATFDPVDREESIQILDLSKTSFDELLVQLEEVSLFGTSKVIIVNNPIFLTSKGSLDDKNQKSFLEYLDNPNLENNFIINSVGLALDKRKKTFKQLLKQSVQVDFEELKPQDISKMAQSAFTRNKIEISRDDLTFFLETIGYDLRLLDSNLEKLILFGKTQSITQQVIIDLTDSNPQDESFQLADAILSNNQKRAIKIYQNLLDLGTSPIQINALLLSQYRLMLQIMSSGLSNDAVAKELKKHPFRVQKVGEATRGLSIEDVSNMYLNLADIDYKLKSTTTDPELMFQLLIAKK